MKMDNEVATSGTQHASGRLLHWVEEPINSVVAASAAVIGSFGLVLAGIGAVHLVVT